MDEIKDVIEKYKNMVYSIALTHVRSKIDADDVFQEVFLALHKKAPKFNDDEHIKAWLIKTTLNCSKKFALTAWKRRVDLTEDVESYGKSGEFSFAFENENMVLMQCVSCQKSTKRLFISTILKK